MLGFKEVSVLDANSEYVGVALDTLMESAGWAVASAVEREFGTGLRVAVLCGTGNNGGDGFVAARYLRERNDVDVILAKTPDHIKGQASWTNYERIQEISKVWKENDLQEYDLLVDALLGVRTEGEPREPINHIIKVMNDSKVPIVSVDIPSGLGSHRTVRPKLTVTFHDVKEGMDPKNSGKIMVEAIGIPEEAYTYCGPGEFAYYPIPRLGSHKGDNGRLLVIGGGPYSGAPYLAAMGAYRIGVDLVRVAAPANVSNVIAGYSPDLIVIPLPGTVLSVGDEKVIKPILRNVDAVLIGPGLGRDPKTMEAVRNLIKICDLPLVLDADAFVSLAGHLQVLKGKTGIITPHAGEVMKITGEDVPEDIEGRKQVAINLAKQSGMTVLMKGAVDVVTDGAETRLNRTGNAGMTVGGTGDVLAGLCAGLLAKGVSPIKAARIAAFTSGSAGDLAFETYSYGLLATDVLNEVPRVMRRALERFQ